MSILFDMTSHKESRSFIGINNNINNKLIHNYMI